MEEKLQQLLVVTGPESSGKSTLSAELAKWLNAPLVVEAARDYLLAKSASERNGSESSYSAEDVLKIARVQRQSEQQALQTGAPVVVADTDHYVLELWWQERFEANHGAYPVKAPKRKHIVTRYLLCYPDIKWQPDPLRENPFDRLRLFKAQMQMLDTRGARYRVIWGQDQYRLRLARQYVKRLLNRVD